VTSSETDRALGSESRFIVKLLEAWNSYDETWSMGLQWSDARPGDLIKLEEVNENDDDEIPLPIEWSDGVPAGWTTVRVVANSPRRLRVRNPKNGLELDLPNEDSYWRVVESSAVDDLKDAIFASQQPEGVAYSDSAVSGRLWSDLRDAVNSIAEGEPVDLHPGSESRVRDLVHPSLYPYVEGQSTSTAPAARSDSDPVRDRFGRPFERSRFQWLPTPFSVQADGTVTIDSYINNLDESKYPEAYVGLARLLEAALPLFASVLGYLDETKFWVEGVEEWSSGVGLSSQEIAEKWLPERKRTKRFVSDRALAGRTLQVIPKIVEYRLTRGERHEGVWHVEGMSHEHIVATCVYVLERDDSLVGGDLQFRRMYTAEEADVLTMGLGQAHLSEALQRVLDEEGAPLGTVPMPEGRLIVFPNSHIHRLTELTLAPSAEEGKRRIIVFWLVDPDVAIHSTVDVAPQQSVFTRDQALQFRLELMEERRLHKQSLNPRAINLCEH